MSKNLKIIFLSKSYFPNIGGVEKHIYEISKILLKKGYSVSIITEESGNNNLPKELELKGLKIYRIPVGNNNWFKKFRIWKWIWSNKQLFLDADLTHCHDVFFWYLPIALIYPLKPVYTTFHGYESYPIKFKAIIYRKIFEYMSNKTICVGDFMKKWYHARPDAVIYGGVHIPKKFIKPQKNTAIFIGRLDEHTGIDVYVEAVQLIRKKIPDFSLTVYGEGPLGEKIKGPGIILKGYDPDADKEIQKYEFAFVSRYLAILEAMAAKRQVFAIYDNPVKKDYLMMTPYNNLIRVVGSAFQLAKMLIGLKNKKQIEDQGFNLVQNLTWLKIVQEYETLWSTRVI